MKKRETYEEREARKDAAYERGWVDSLTAHWCTSQQPSDDIYDYVRGWWACADYRWEDPTNQGRAPDSDFRIPRKASRYY